MKTARIVVGMVGVADRMAGIAEAEMMDKTTALAAIGKFAADC
jgi:hypothetical protein